MNIVYHQGPLGEGLVQFGYGPETAVLRVVSSDGQIREVATVDGYVIVRRGGVVEHIVYAPDLAETVRKIVEALSLVNARYWQQLDKAADEVFSLVKNYVSQQELMKLLLTLQQLGITPTALLLPTLPLAITITPLSTVKKEGEEDIFKKLSQQACKSKIEEVG